MQRVNTSQFTGHEHKDIAYHRYPGKRFNLVDEAQEDTDAQANRHVHAPIEAETADPGVVAKLILAKLGLLMNQKREL